MGLLQEGGKSRVLQIGDYLDDVGEDEIESVIETTKGARINLNFGGTNLTKNSNAYGRSLDGELVGASRGVGLDGGRLAFTGPGGQRVVGLGRQHTGKIGALGAVLCAAQLEDPVTGSC